MLKSSPRSSAKADSPMSPTVTQNVDPSAGITDSDVSKIDNSNEIVKEEQSAKDTKPASSTGTPRSKQSPVKKPKTTKRRKQKYCLCEGEDDGSPMIRCEGPCKKW